MKVLKKIHSSIVLKMYYVDEKLLNDIKLMYVSNLACVSVKGGEIGTFEAPCKTVD